MTTDEEFRELISVAVVKMSKPLMLNVVTGDGKVLNLVMAGVGWSTCRNESAPPRLESQLLEVAEAAHERPN